MTGKLIRAAIVGASSLLGKELAEELNESASTQWDFKLLDVGAEESQLTSAGDEAVVIQPLEAGSFAGQDVVFFAADAAVTNEYWKAAVSAGVSVVDLTGALSGRESVTVASPWVRLASASPAVDLSTVAIVSAHPVAVMLGLALSRISEKSKVTRAIATVLEPASQAGSAGLDEMHSQTVSLLSFQAVPKEVFDAQVAFNLNIALGEAAKVDLQAVSQKIQADLRAVTGEAVASTCTLQLVQAPVFNGYAISLFVEVAEAVQISTLEQLLNGGIIEVPDEDEPAPSNQSATEQGKMLVQVRSAGDGEQQGTGFWLWMTADNLRLAARNAVACATELLALRPGGRVQ